LASDLRGKKGSVIRQGRKNAGVKDALRREKRGESGHRTSGGSFFTP